MTKFNWYDRNHGIRPLSTYRGFRRNAVRGKANIMCRTERRLTGETRSQFDRRRWTEAIIEANGP